MADIKSDCQVLLYTTHSKHKMSVVKELIGLKLSILGPYRDLTPNIVQPRHMIASILLLVLAHILAFTTLYSWIF